MIINSLSLVNFRNYESTEIRFNERLNIIIGPNGQGKTNIIEALYLLLEGDSFRYSVNENLIKLKESQAYIRANAVNDGLDYKIVLTINNNKKSLSVNDKPVSHSKLDKFSAVLFSPESLSVIKESADERRQLIDQLVEQIVQNGSTLIREFRKTLRARNRILKDIAEEKVTYQMGQDTLQSINSIYLKLASQLSYLRIKTLHDIKPEVEKSLNNIHRESTVTFDFNYMMSDVDHKSSDLEKIAFFMKKRMQELEVAELKSGVSLVGPQKHDISFLYNGNDSRFYCSQGQQRSIILAYKMAQIVYHHRVHGFYPLLLLDDVLSELDLAKQESLISTLNQTETQTFVTTTDVTLLPKLSMNKASVFNIRNGLIV